MFTCTPFYLANFVFLFEVSLLPFCSTHRFRFLRLPLVSPIGCLVLAVSPRAFSRLPCSLPRIVFGGPSHVPAAGLVLGDGSPSIFLLCLDLGDFPASIFQPLHLTPPDREVRRGSLLAYRTHGLPIVAVVLAPVTHLTRIEAHVQRAVRDICAE